MRLLILMLIMSISTTNHINSTTLSGSLGPLTVESLSPNRFLGFDENDELIDNHCDDHGVFGAKSDFANIILDNLKLSGVQQAHKEDRIDFSSVKPWPGILVCAEGFFEDIANENERKSSDSSTKRTQE